MLIIPAIDLKDGQCVRLKQGLMDDATVFSNSPGEQAAHWLEQGARRLHVVDLNGAFAGKQKNERAIETSRRLAAEEGIFVGISAGATAATALEVAASAPAGSVILAMLPDTGERYFSTPLFADVNEGSDDDWLAGLP